MEAEIRAYLKACLPTGNELERLVAGTGPDGVHPNRGWVYDAELGFVHAPSIHRGDGVNGANTFYDYEDDGARRSSTVRAGRAGSKPTATASRTATK